MTESETESELLRHRADNLRALAGRGVEAYPHRFAHDIEVRELVARYAPMAPEALESAAPAHAVPGRVMSMRIMGKAAFCDISDGAERVQVYARRDEIGEEGWERYRLLDLGDLVGVHGVVFRTRTGELSVKARSVTLLAKSLRPLPEKWHGLTDLETRYRQRYLDLIANPESRRIFEVRSRLVAGLRRFLDGRGFLEVETPMLQALASGAAARPFVTHHNALDMDLFLRIAPELYLKRLVVGGMSRVYEINRNFRNEGLSTRHNPEFTMLEFYQAYADYNDLMALTEEMIPALAQEVLGTTQIKFRGHDIDLTPPWPRRTLAEAIAFAGGPPAVQLAARDGLLAAADGAGIENAAALSDGKLLVALFETLAEPHLVAPVFVHEYPTEVSPLSKQKPGAPEVTERFELYIGGMEVANAFSELNDPEEQEARFRQQAGERERGNDEAMAFDEDYVTALEYGLPPTAGEGIGIDRLAMLFTGQDSIRDVILFPLMRPRA